MKGTKGFTKGNTHNRTHGHCPDGGPKSPTYNSWMNMKQRCNNPNADNYERYGGRGITVCDRWATFAIFLEDMGVRPDGKTLDRIENDGNYEPANCKWSTLSEQQLNRRCSKEVH